MERLTGPEASVLELAARRQGKRNFALFQSGPFRLSRCLDEGDWHVVVHATEPEVLRKEEFEPLVRQVVPGVKRWEVLSVGEYTLHFWEYRGE